jgi:hypothetical protein
MSWKDFLAAHMSVLAGADFFTVEVLKWRGLMTYYVLFFIHLEKEDHDPPESPLVLMGEPPLHRSLTEYAAHYPPVEACPIIYSSMM